LPDIWRSAAGTNRDSPWRRRSSRAALRRDGVRTLAVNLSEHDVQRTQNGRDVGEHVPAIEEIHGGQMRKSRRADFRTVWTVGAVGHEIDAEFALRRLDGGIDLAFRNLEALGVELEVMDERFHRTLHLAPLGRHHLVVDRGDRAGAFRRAQLLAALLDDLG